MKANAAHPITLRFRINLVLVILMALTLFAMAVALFRQHRIAVTGEQDGIEQLHKLVRTDDFREGLAAVSGMTGNRVLLMRQLEKQRTILTELLMHASRVEETGLIRKMADRFEAFSAAELGRIKDFAGFDPAVNYNFEEAQAAAGALVDYYQNNAYRIADMTRKEQADSIRSSAIVLTGLMVILVLTALRMIRVATEPLNSLSRVLDHVNLEDDLPITLPPSAWSQPEVARLASSFEQLLVRLRSFRALNVKRLLLEKRRADVIAASISEGIFLLRGSEILYVNPVGERILGLPKGIGWKGLELQRSELKTSGMVAVKTALSRTMPVELELDSIDGRKQFYLLQSYPIPIELIEQVEHSIEGSTQLLDRWQANTLVLAQDVTIVREGQDAKSHFIATLSHEVKTPVTSLTMATRLLRKSMDQIPSETHRTLIQTCAEDVDRLRVLLEDLLSVSRFDSLTQRLDIKRVDIAKLMKQSIQFFQAEAFDRGVEFTTQIAIRSKSLGVPMDATKVSWAISNLLVNALRHSPRGGKVEVTLSEREHFAEIRVRDHGPGIEHQRQDKIFDKFKPFYDLRVARSGSIGMGLAIAKEIITAHGGSIWVASEPGHGAEFCFTLPLRTSSSLSKSEGQGVAKLRTATKGDNSGKTARGG